MPKILVIRFSSLGDVVLTGPVFEALKQAWPDAELIALTKDSFADVFRTHPAVSKTISLQRGQSIRSLIRAVRAEHIDIIVDLHANLRSRLVCLMGGAKRVVRYRKAALARRLYVGWRLAAKTLAEHTLDRYFRALQPLGIQARPERLLVIQTAFLGDAVLTLPFLVALRERFPTSPITVLCTPEVADVFERHPAVHDIIRFDKRGQQRGLAALGRFAQDLRRRAYPMAFLPHRSMKSALIAWLAGIPRRIGFSTSQGRWLLTDVVPFRWGTHDVDRNLSLLQAVGSDVRAGQLTLRPEPAAEEKVHGRMRESGIGAQDSVLGINAGSVWATKRWTAAGFAQVADRAARELGAKVIFFGGPADLPTVEQVLAKMRQPAISWVGKTDLRDLIAAIACCDAFLTNDSGPMHIAVATGVPTVAIFGPTTKELGFFPYGPGHIVIERELPCRPCGLHGAKACPLGHFQCMETISAEDVFQAVSGQLAKRRRRPAVGTGARE